MTLIFGNFAYKHQSIVYTQFQYLINQQNQFEKPNINLFQSQALLQRSQYWYGIGGTEIL